MLPSQQDDAGGDVVGQQNLDPLRPNVVVSGWQVYDNKGRVVEKIRAVLFGGLELFAAYR